MSRPTYACKYEDVMILSPKFDAGSETECQAFFVVSRTFPSLYRTPQTSGYELELVHYRRLSQLRTRRTESSIHPVYRVHSIPKSTILLG